MNEKVITGIYMAISSASFFTAFAYAEGIYQTAMAVGMLWMMNVIIRLASNHMNK